MRHADTTTPPPPTILLSATGPGTPGVQGLKGDLGDFLEPHFSGPTQHPVPST